MEKPKRYGGRKKGTPNIITAEVRSVLADVTSDYYTSGRFLEDFSLLEPKDRLDVFVKILPYITPKLQAVTADVTSSSARTIEDRLAQLSQDNE